MDISTILLIVAAAFLFIGICVGFARGLGRSTIGLVCILLACVLTFIFTIPLAEKLVNTDISPVVQKIGDVEVTTISDTVTNYVNDNETLVTLLKDNPALTNCINALPVFVLSIVLFYILLLVALLVSALLYVIFQWPIMKLITKDQKNKKKFLSRLAGCGIGAIASLLVFAILFVPVLGFLNVSEKIVYENASLQEFNENYYTPLTQSQVVTVLDKLGFDSFGEYFLTKASAFEDGKGKKMSIMNEADSLADIYALLQENGIIDEISEDGLDTEKVLTLLADREFTKDLMSRMLKSDLLIASVPQIAALGAKALAQSLELPASNEEAYNNLANEIATLINENCNEIELSYAYDQYINGNIIVVDEASSQLKDTSSAVPDSSFVRFRVKENGTVYIASQTKGSIGKLDANNAESKTPNVELITISDIKEKTEETQEKVTLLLKSTVKSDETISDTQYEDTSANMVKAASAQLANISNYSSKETKISVSDVKLVLNSDDVKLNEVKENQFKNAEITGEDLAKSFSEGIDNLLNGDKEVAANTLADLISPIAEALPSLMNTGSEQPEGSEKKNGIYIDPNLGSVLSVIRDSESLNGIGSDIIDALSQSDSLKDVLSEDITNSLKEVYADKNADIGKVASVAIAAADMVINTREDGDKETSIKSIEELITNLDKDTLPVLLNLFSLDLIKSYVKDDEIAETAKSIIDKVMTILAEESAEDLKTDAEAIRSLYFFATNTPNFTSDDIVELADYAIKSNLLRKTLHSCNTYRFPLSSSQKSSFIPQLRNAYINSDAPVAQKNQVFNDIALILDLGISF